MNKPVNLFEFEALAKEKVEKSAYDYIAGGAEDEITLKDNREAWERIRFRPRVLVDVSEIKTSTEVLGQEISLPVVIAPTALQQLVHPDAEIATAKAASAAKTIFTLSSISTRSIEEVAESCEGPRWFQLYYSKDKSITENLLKRAKGNGYSAICLTVDTPRLGRREQDFRNQFTLPPGVLLKNYEEFVDLENMPPDLQGSALAAFAFNAMDPSMNWEDLAWIKETAQLPLILKGIVTAEDARKAIDYDVDGIIVSNHGGRQLDGAPATIEALPEVVHAVKGRIDVLVDGGVRRGTDIVKALALGAKAVLIGRPYVWGLAADGELGVKRVIGMLREEFELAMSLVGCNSVQQLDRSYLSLEK